MKDRKIFTELSPDEVKELFFKEKEVEKHSIWNFFGSYNSPREGLHIYETKKGLKGYYEDGSRNRYGSLQHLKTWFSLKIKPTEDGSIVQCRVEYNPYLFFLFFCWVSFLLGAIIKREWLAVSGLIFALIIMFVFLNDEFNKEDLIFQMIRNRLGVIEDKEQEVS